MDGHKHWIRRGIEDGVFLLVGSLQPNLGGAIVALDSARATLQDRVNLDPFVTQGVVSPEILKITPSEVDERLKFLLH
jgi:uncharacterized protein YciI